MKTFLRKLWRGEEGAELVEWVIVASVLIATASAGYVFLGDSVNYAANEVGEKVNTAVGNVDDPEEGADGD